MIRNHITVAVSGLIVSDVNFNFFMFSSQTRILFSASLVSYCFDVIGTPCPINFVL